MEFVRRNKVKGTPTGNNVTGTNNYYFGGGTTYDDTQVRKDINQNKENINLLFVDLQATNDEVSNNQIQIGKINRELKEIPNTYLSKVAQDTAQEQITFKKGLVSDIVKSSNYNHGNGFGLIREGDNSQFVIGGATEKVTEFKYATHQEQPTTEFISKKVGIATKVNVTVESDKAFLRFNAKTSVSDYKNMHFNSKTVQYYYNNDIEQKHDCILVDFTQDIPNGTANSTYQVPLPSGNNNITIILNVDYSNKPTEKVATLIMTLEGLLPQTDQTIIYGITKVSTLSPTGLQIIEEQKGIWYSVEGIQYSDDGGKTWHK